MLFNKQKHSQLIAHFVKVEKFIIHQ